MELNSIDLQQTVYMLIALSNPTRVDHVNALNVLSNLTIQEKNRISLYLTYIFVYNGNLTTSQCNECGLNESIRQLAGFALKNYLLKSFHLFDNQIRLYIQTSLLEALSIQSISNIASICLSYLFLNNPIDIWVNDIFPHLINYLSVDLNTYEYVCLASLSTIYMTLEEVLEKIPLTNCLPKLLDLIDNNTNQSIDSYLSIKYKAFLCINATLYLLGYSNCNNKAILLLHMNRYITIISKYLSLDLSNYLSNLSNIYLSVCQSFVLLATYDLSICSSIYHNMNIWLIKLFTNCSDEIGFVICDYWLIHLSNDIHKQNLLTYLPLLLPILISKLVLTSEQIEIDRRIDKEEASGERPLDIKPLIYVDNEDSNERIQLSRTEYNARVEEEKELSSYLSIRKQSAIVLDTISQVFDNSIVLQHTLPSIELRLKSSNVLERESGLLALGALANGCYEAMIQYLPDLLPFLLESTKDEMLEVRSISCWVLSRYCHFYYLSNNQSNYLPNVLIYLTNCLQDKEPKVQCASVSALCIVIEESDNESIKPYITNIIQFIHQMFPLYGIKAKVLLIDLIEVICETLGPHSLVDYPNIVELFFPFIYDIFISLDISDSLLFPILECFLSTLPAIGRLGEQYAITIYQKCLNIIDKGIHSVIGEKVNYINKELAIVSLDVISCLSTAFNENFEPIILTNMPISLPLLFSCLYDSMSQLRQSAFSVFGEICKNGPIQLFITVNNNNLNGILSNYLSNQLSNDLSNYSNVLLSSDLLNQLLDIIISNLNLSIYLVYNNAIWTYSELIQRLYKYISNYLVTYITTYLPNYQQLTNQSNIFNNFIENILINLLNQYNIKIFHYLIIATLDEETPDVLQQNIAILWGVACRYLTTSAGIVIDEIFREWCGLLRLVTISNERTEALYGLLSILCYKPILISNRINSFDINITNKTYNQINNKLVNYSDNFIAFLYVLSTLDRELDDKTLILYFNKILNQIIQLDNQLWLDSLVVVGNETRSQLYDIFIIR